MICTVCNGRKTTKYTVQEYGSKEPPVEHEMECTVCYGTGVITLEVYKYLEWEKAQWCKCKDSNSGSFYVPDNTDDRCDKHHWRCNTCKLITQIG